MTFEQFKKITYHTRNTIRIPGSRTVIDKVACMVKGKFNHAKANELLEEVYNEENFAER
jgi:hypothetical protein